MTHPYIGRTFRLEWTEPFPIGRDFVIPRAVCVAVLDHGAGIFRRPDLTHISAHLTDVVGPLDEPPAADIKERA